MKPKTGKLLWHRAGLISSTTGDHYVVIEIPYVYDDNFIDWSVNSETEQRMEACIYSIIRQKCLPGLLSNVDILSAGRDMTQPETLPNIRCRIGGLAGHGNVKKYREYFINLRERYKKYPK